MSKKQQNISSGDPSVSKDTLSGDLCLLKDPVQLSDSLDRLIHVYRNDVICQTDDRGYATPRNRDPLELRFDATQGFIPVWQVNQILRWRFQERSLLRFQEPDLLKAYVRRLLNEGIRLWGDAVPISFTEQDELWDFEITINPVDDCDSQGRCVLASAFFPNSGQNRLVLYPRMFQQSDKEQADTMAHELGHIFGLRHFFANVTEDAFPSELFGTDSRFSIMNYGSDSSITSNDINDLRRFYQAVWTGSLTNVNGTPVRLLQPFHTTRDIAPVC